ncbi:DUF2809 domain-containing protein [Seonamhaeicola sp. MEBiC1930]|uniref:DUF2809 domain-containing protein n=1 Tax=Seonamhaeicola sp. MEBiC01930 TaxID=2976768 RepID=UPI0038736007
MNLQINRTYLLLFLLLFSIEALIAIFVPTGFIRYTLGDYLVVILIYCFAKIFIKGHSNIIAISTLIFSFSIEFLQLSGILDKLNQQLCYKINFRQHFSVVRFSSLCIRHFNNSNNRTY